MKSQTLTIGDSNTTAKDVIEIIKKLCAENPNMTVKEYLDKLNKSSIILV